MSSMRRGRPRWRSTVEERILIEEVEHFLSGGLAADLLAIGVPVPAWAWLGFLAHTPEDELEVRAEAVFTMGPADAASLLWQGAVALLVQEIVDTSKQSGCTVGDLQRALMVELEARPGRGALTVDPGTGRFIQEVCSVLVHCRDGGDR